MLLYVLRRLLLMIPMVVFITAFVFLLGQFAAPDIAFERTIRLNDGVFDPEIYETLRVNMGLDGSVLERFGRFIAGAVTGDFGVSWTLPGNPEIGPLILKALPISMQLGAAALVMALAVGIPLGVLAAAYRGKFGDYATVTVATILASIPPFVLAPLALVLFVTTIPILPTTGFGWHGIFSVEAILPAALLAVGPLIIVVRYTRAAVIDTMAREFIRAARAKGLAERLVIGRHVLKNSMTPLLSAIGVIAGFLLSGTIFIETVFGIKGFGFVSVTAFRSGDINTVAAATLVSGMITAIVNLVTDLCYGVLDPRVRIEA
ncbi:ABC transporter permease [Bauldia sp.]|uniref:ABC transporter permease n=1 Tax=Bauldia sp. TaxID=2575872 RepID=UPI003BAC17BB